MILITISNPIEREKFADIVPINTQFINLIHPPVVMSESIHIYDGSIIRAGSILTTNLKLGKYVHINPHYIISHKCEAGNFLATAPAENNSGNCKFSQNIYAELTLHIKKI
jgi:UDP-3-O-[3-hydroxymyristoyl] glucosamine N-acyltransferase